MTCSFTKTPISDNFLHFHHLSDLQKFKPFTTILYPPFPLFLSICIRISPPYFLHFLFFDGEHSRILCAQKSPPAPKTHSLKSKSQKKVPSPFTCPHILSPSPSSVFFIFSFSLFSTPFGGTAKQIPRYTRYFIAQQPVTLVPASLSLLAKRSVHSFLFWLGGSLFSSN